MFLWSRREIYAGYSMRRFVELRNRLETAGIPISYRFVAVNDGGRRSVITNCQIATRYHLYVHARDYGRTQAFLKKSLAKNFNSLRVRLRFKLRK